MKNIFIRSGVILISLSIMSCSIKSDRDDCPCRMNVFLDRMFSNLSMQMAQNGQICYNERIDYNGLQGNQYTLEIVRGFYTVSLFQGKTLIPVGYQADSIYAWSSIDAVNAFCDDLDIIPVMNKQFATLFLDFENFGQLSELMSVVVESDVCGIDPITMEPLNGEFRYEFMAQKGESYSLRLPRQLSKGSQLKISIVNDGQVQGVLPVGSYLNANGYDWEDESLSDIYMNVNCVDSYFSYSIKDWSTGFDIVKEL